MKDCRLLSIVLFITACFSLTTCESDAEKPALNELNLSVNQEVLLDVFLENEANIETDEISLSMFNEFNHDTEMFEISSV